MGAYRPHLEPWAAAIGREGFTLDRVAPGRFLMGSGAEIRAELASWAEATGADYLALRMRHPGGPSHQAVLQALTRFGEEVIERPHDDGGQPSAGP